MNDELLEMPGYWQDKCLGGDTSLLLMAFSVSEEPKPDNPDLDKKEEDDDEEEDGGDSYE